MQQSYFMQPDLSQNRAESPSGILSTSCSPQPQCDVMNVLRSGDRQTVGKSEGHDGDHRQLGVMTSRLSPSPSSVTINPLPANKPDTVSEQLSFMREQHQPPCSSTSSSSAASKTAIRPSFLISDILGPGRSTSAHDKQQPMSAPARRISDTNYPDDSDDEDIDVQELESESGTDQYA